MKIKLSNGTVLSPILATGETRYVQGANRDTLNFIFPATEGMEALDAAFSTENCESITVLEAVEDPDGTTTGTELPPQGLYDPGRPEKGGRRGHACDRGGGGHL